MMQRGVHTPWIRRNKNHRNAFNSVFEECFCFDGAPKCFVLFFVSERAPDTWHLTPDVGCSRVVCPGESRHSGRRKQTCDEKESQITAAPGVKIWHLTRIKIITTPDTHVHWSWHVHGFCGTSCNKFTSLSPNIKKKQKKQRLGQNE